MIVFSCCLFFCLGFRVWLRDRVHGLGYRTYHPEDHAHILLAYGSSISASGTSHNGCCIQQDCLVFRSVAGRPLASQGLAGQYHTGWQAFFLADGYFCEVWCLIGDLDYWRDKLKQVNCNSLVPCCLCPCNSSSMPWHHFSFGAQWLQHIYTTTAWKASGASACLLFLITGVDNQSLHPDWMHAKHLGSDKVLGGSVLYLLIYFMLPGTVAENLIRVWNAIQEVYHLDNVKNRFGSLTTNMFAGTRGLRFRV